MAGSRGARHRSIGAVIAVAVALVATALATATPAGAVARGTLSLSPNTHLTPGQIVNVSGVGWDPNSAVGLLPCPAEYYTQDLTDCAPLLDAVWAPTDTQGSFSTTLAPPRDLRIGGPGFEVDCLSLCYIVAVVEDPVDSGQFRGAATAGYSFVPLLPTIIPGSHSVYEGNTGTTALEIPLTLGAPPSPKTVTAQWRTVFVPGAPGNQADPATDYTPAAGTVSFEPGGTYATVTVEVKGDTVPEPDEYIVVQFGNPTNATMGGFWGLGFGSISDDDDVSIAPGSASVAEGNAGTTALKLPVSINKTSPYTVTAQWKTVFVAGAPGNQADPASDYIPASGTVTFPPGYGTVYVNIDVNGDTRPEPDEYIVVQFGDPTYARMGGFWGLGFATITNDDSS